MLDKPLEVKMTLKLIYKLHDWRCDVNNRWNIFQQLNSPPSNERTLYLSQKKLDVTQADDFQDFPYTELLITFVTKFLVEIHVNYSVTHRNV